jgi:hypothetical protein
MHAASTPETSVNFYQISLRKIPDNNNLYIVSSSRKKLVSINLQLAAFTVIFLFLINE